MSVFVFLAENVNILLLNCIALINMLFNRYLVLFFYSLYSDVDGYDVKF